MSGELTTRMNEIEDLVYEHVGERFNINSTQQLSNAIFNQLKLSPPDRTRRTDSGHYSTSAEVLEALRGKHPVVDLLLEYRELSKLRSTYLDALPQQVNPITGRIHTSYNQTGSVTGRIASSDPNLQNIPIRTELGRHVRQAFIAAPGCNLLSVDYSQVELRIAAHMSNDQAMLSAFRAGQDIHTATAAAILNITLDKVTKGQRRNAKAINFGLIYGMSAFGLTRSSDLTLAEAEDFVEAYFKQFPGIKSYLDNMRRDAAKKGFVETLLGRRRYFPGLKSQGNPSTRAREEREAINAPIQGTAADIMKIAMQRVPMALLKNNLNGHMLLQVHDELVLECPENELKQTAKIVRNVMENAYNLIIPLQTEARVGLNWGEMTVLEE
jgi:DNA polymerase-1